MDALPLSRPFDTRRLGDAPLFERIDTTPEERAALAKAYELLALERLDADLTVSPWQRVGVKVSGRLVADLVQACVVTLEPVPQHLDHAFELAFLPPQDKVADPKTVAEAEVIVAYDEDDPPDPLLGPVIDLGAIVAEQLALGIDPYPRAPGADLAAEIGDASDASPSPFAALAGLKRDAKD